MIKKRWKDSSIFKKLPSFLPSRIGCISEVCLVSAGLTTEGLYRVSGNKTDQDNIQKLFDQGTEHLHLDRAHEHPMVTAISGLRPPLPVAIKNRK